MPSALYPALAALCWLAALGTARADGWPVPAAPIRLVIERAENAPAHATVGSVNAWSGPLEPAKCAVYVTTTSGQVVGSQLLWSAPGEPLRVVFDATANAAAYHLYLTTAAPPPSPAWEPAAGVLLETRVAAAGKLDSWAALRQLWQASTNLQGRSLLPQLYQGHNPHGPSAGFVARYRGTLQIDKAGEYALATISGDASFLLVADKLLAQWPGCHGPWAGRHGQHHGKIRLGVGTQRFEYYHAHRENEPLAALAWRPPGRDRFEIVPEKQFGAIAQFQVIGAEAMAGQAPPLYAEWLPQEHTALQGLHLVNMRLRLPGAPKARTYHWRFDDGATATGTELEHLFVRPGLRRVSLEARAEGRPVASAHFLVAVRPHWSQLEDWPGEVARRQKSALLGRDLAALPVADLAYLVRYADLLQDRALLTALGQASWQRQTDIPAGEAQIFHALALHYADTQVREYPRAEQACRAVLALRDADPLLHHRCRLKLAELLIHQLARPEEAGPLLAAIQLDGLAPPEQRQRQILQADLALALGDLTTARQRYRAIGSLSPAQDPQNALRRRARLEAAQLHLARGNLDEAEHLLREISWDSPAEQLSLETGLALLKLHLARKEPLAALARCRALLPIADTDSARAELLYHHTAIQFGLGQDKTARESLARLLAEHPYSEPAARAQDTWGAATPSPATK